MPSVKGLSAPDCLPLRRTLSQKSDSPAMRLRSLSTGVGQNHPSGVPNALPTCPITAAQAKKVETMRQRQDFYTLCPGCETRVELTLAAKLQAARAGCSCECHTCKHEWVCIQEWIYRDEPLDHALPVAASQSSQSAIPDHAAGLPRTPPATVATQPPRPHLPTFQPPQPVAPSAQQQPAASAGEPHLAADQPSQKPVPAPHAWSWERSTRQQPSKSQDSQSGAGH